MLVAWLLGLGAVAVGGLFADPYHRHVLRLPDPQPYPLTGVSQFALVVTAQAFLLWAILGRAGRASFVRRLVALLAFAAITFYFGMALLHAPPYQFGHFLWSLSVVVALLVALVRPGR